MNLVMRVKRGKSGGTAATARPRFIALSDPTRAPDPQTMLSKLPRGSALIWRAYNVTPSRAALANLARAARQHHVTLLVATAHRTNIRPASTSLHLAGFKLKTPHTDKIHAPARRRSPAALVTAAAHSEAGIIAAARAHVDAVLISPVFATASHVEAHPLGVTRFARLATLARAHGLGVYALGGITDKTRMRRLKGSSPSGFAGIGFFKS